MSKTRIQAIISQNRRDEVRTKIYLYMLTILMLAFVAEEFKVILQPHTFQYTAEASTNVSLESNSNDSVVSVDVRPSELTDNSAGSKIPAPSKIEEFIINTFPQDQKIALALFKTESGLNPTQPSTIDVMLDGRPFSTGLVQLNLTQHRIGSLECHKAFRGKNYKAVVIDEDLYQKCLTAANNPQIALEKAREIYEGRGNTFNAWGAYTNLGYLRNL